MRTTPNAFLWGVSTSSYQVEGGITNNDWNLFTTSEEIKKRISTLTKPSVFYKNSTQIVLKPAGDAVRFWDPKYYEKDFELARSLGLNTFRIGMEWARIEPERGQWDQDAIEHYRKMIKAMRERGLMPVISLNHATLPLWVLTPPTIFTKRIGQTFLVIFLIENTRIIVLMDFQKRIQDIFQKLKILSCCN